MKCGTSASLIGVQKNLGVLTLYEAPSEYFSSNVKKFTVHAS